MLNRLGFIPWRLLQAIPIVFGLTIIVFSLSKLLPGDAAVAMLGERAGPDALEALREKLGLNRPAVEQYFLYIGRLLHGDLGDSLMYHMPVKDVLPRALPVTLSLVVYAVILALIISIPLASLAASRPNGVRDLGVRGYTLVAQGMPQMWVGIMLMLLLSLHFRIFPIGRYGSGLENVRNLFLPALTLAIALSPTLIRSLRQSIIEVRDADFVATARSKGAGGFALFRGHILRNAILPTVSVVGVHLSYIVGGSIVIERVFNLPGIGQLMIQAILNRDFPLMQAVTLLIGLLVIAIGILTDVVYALLDPRVAVGRSKA
ncbi:ABC transporter permease [Micromonospora cremea]|uniref:Peptide/nickel transport system permease protein n=1 Tax=Micromonospora cremea TaxID=709881 RepID=A0A1N5TDR6_9ACTN|nr:ABC transporter permease [Micromonospora cremea]SIM46248.1 peptide/nickel transport system permease protein [Micromonospora cremea]